MYKAVSRRIACAILLLDMAVGLFAISDTHASPSAPPQWIFAPIEQDFVEKFVSLSENSGKPVILGSAGGNPEVALKVAAIIKVKKVPLTIVGSCLSACAEILLPAASAYSQLIFYRKPLIGFHHNSAISKALIPDDKSPVFDRCFSQVDQKFRKFREETGVPYDVWRTQLSYLKPIAGESFFPADCHSYKLAFERKFWFPTSEQLRKDFNLHFSGEVCADDLECAKGILLDLGKNGERFVVGLRVFEIKIKSDGTKYISEI